MQLLTNLFLACLKSKSWIGWFVKSLPENGTYHYDLQKNGKQRNFVHGRTRPARFFGRRGREYGPDF